jgi:hypothetical protein
MTMSNFRTGLLHHEATRGCGEGKRGLEMGRKECNKKRARIIESGQSAYNWH